MFIAPPHTMTIPFPRSTESTPPSNTDATGAWPAYMPYKKASVHFLARTLARKHHRSIEEAIKDAIKEEKKVVFID